MDRKVIEIRKAKNDIEQYKKLIIEYGEGFYSDEQMRHLRLEMEEIHIHYGHPKGVMLGAYMGDVLCGCIAYRSLPQLDGKCCEVRRFYVKSDFRGMGIGRKLLTELLYKAKRKGYEYAYLDTFLHMDRAMYLYDEMGFEKTEPYFLTNLKDIIFYKLNLLSLC